MYIYIYNTDIIQIYIYIMIYIYIYFKDVYTYIYIKICFLSNLLGAWVILLPMNSGVGLHPVTQLSAKLDQPKNDVSSGV